MNFQTWGESYPEVVQELWPNFGTRQWDDLSTEDKEIIWLHLDYFLFIKDPETSGIVSISTYQRPSLSKDQKSYYYFRGEFYQLYKKQKKIITAVENISKKYKVNNFAPFYLCYQIHNCVASIYANIS